MPASQPPNDPSQRMRIAPHLDLEHTKLRPTEPDQGGGDLANSPDPRAKAQEAREGTGRGAAPPAVHAPRPQRGNRALWFLALAAAALVASIFLREVKHPTQDAVSDPSGVSGGSVMAPMPSAEPAPAD